MAIKVLKFVNGIPKEINPSVDSIAAKSFIVGGASGTELTKTLMDTLLGGGDASALHSHDNQYYTKAQVDAAIVAADDGGGLSAEITRAVNAEEALGLRIDGKASQQDLATEASARIAGDAASISASAADATTKAASALASANTYTDTTVDAEATARSNEDATLLKLDGSRPMTGNITMSNAFFNQVVTSDATGSDSSPIIFVKSGSAVDGNSGAVGFGSGDSANGEAGPVVIFSGQGADGVRNNISLEAASIVLMGYINASSNKIGNLADGTEPTDAVNKRQLDAAAAAIQNTLDTPIQRQVYVNKNGNDSTATGSMLKPFLTIKAAINSITDASGSKQYLVKVGAGQYGEDADFSLKGNVHIQGEGTYLVTIYKTSGSITWNSTYTDMTVPGSREFVTIKDVYIPSPVEFTGVLGAKGYLSFLNCDLGSDITSSQPEMSLQALITTFNNCNVNGHIRSSGFAIQQIYNSSVNNVTLGNAAITDYSQGNSHFIRGCNTTLSGSLVLNGSGAGLYTTYFNNITLNSNGRTGRTFTYDVVSAPLNITQSHATLVNVIRMSHSTNLSYTRSVSSNWDNAPTVVNTALDELASRVKNSEAGITAEQIRATAQELLKLDKAGGVMSGDLNMGANQVKNIENGSDAQDAVSLSQLNAAINSIEAGAGSSYVPLTQKGSANGVATLDSNGKLTASQTPAIAITNTFVVANQAAQDAIVGAEEGDVAVRTDLNKSFIKLADGSYQELLTPTDSVFSVNGQSGTVVLTTADVTESGDSRYYTAARQSAQEAYVIAEKNLAIEEASSDATEKADVAQAVAIEAAAIDAQDKADAAQAAAESYADAAVLIETEDRVEADLIIQNQVDRKADGLWNVQAGEDVLAGDMICMRSNGSGEMRAYKASCLGTDNVDFNNNGRWEVVGFAMSSVAAEEAFDIKVGQMVIANSDIAITSSDIGKSVYLAAAGKVVVYNSPTGAGDCIVYLGRVVEAGVFWLTCAQLRGVISDE